MTQFETRGFLAPLDLEEDLLFELTQVLGLKLKQQHERVFLVHGPVNRRPVFSHLTLLNPEIVDFKSIKEASSALRDRQALWSHHSQLHYRRSELIQSQLPKVKRLEHPFGAPLPIRELGYWQLLENQKLLCSSQTDFPFSLGEIPWHLSKEAPSRAYLKLWEFFTKMDIWPQKGETCLDLGASPGGWTWVLDGLGCEVRAIDKAALEPRLLQSPRVQHLKADAFLLSPEELGPVDWLFSDVICYPEKLRELVLMWLESGLVKNLVCTIKFQGKTDFECLKRFLNIPGSQAIHLCANKHEVTWSYLGTRPKTN